MAERKDTENPGSEPAPETKAELPAVESPSISPAEAQPFTETAKVEVDKPPTESPPETVSEPASPPHDAAIAAKRPHIPMPNFSLPRITMSARAKRSGILAASVALAAGFGAVIGALESSSFIAAQKPVDAAGLAERQAMHDSITRLSTEIAALKAGIEAAGKETKTASADFAERVARVEQSLSTPETTGSISGPVPMPRPAPDAPPKFAGYGNIPVVRDWEIRAVRNGHVLVHGYGETYDVVPGAPLPGLGRIETIKRLDGRWVVVTPGGIITARRDRAYFERF